MPTNRPMRIAHTADWHAGRVWKSLDRLNETAAALDHLARFVEREKVDLLLMAGDVFDAPTAPAEAEKLVFGFFRRLGRLGVPSVVIAGNHDSPARVEAWGHLAELAGVRTIGRPRPADRGGVVEIPTASGQTAVVAALPFAPARMFVSGLELAVDGGEASAKYADGFRRAVESLTRSFRPNTVNLLMAHTHLDGAVIGNSERQVHIGADWAAAPQAIPAAAQYCALGHIHRPQQVGAAGCPTYYSGSLLQLDFGEAGQAKGFNLVEVESGRPARVEFVPTEGGKPLADLRLTFPEIEARRAELLAAGWLRVVVPLEQPDPDLARKVRQLVPNALVVNAELPPALAPVLLVLPGADSTPSALYAGYHERRHGRPPSDEVATGFGRLYREAGGVGETTG